MRGERGCGEKLQLCRLPSATREKGRRPILSRRRNGCDEHISIHSGFSTSLPTKYSFAFSKIYRNIPPVYFVSLFVVRLKNNINISFFFFSFFSKYLGKIFFQTTHEIFDENNKRGEKYRNSFRYKLKSKSNFILSRRKESRFKSIFSG